MFFALVLTIVMFLSLRATGLWLIWTVLHHLWPSVVPTPSWLLAAALEVGRSAAGLNPRSNELNKES